MKSYVFILCPPYCGSTILWKLVSTSDTISALPREGQFLPEVETIMRKSPWDTNLKLPWKEIKVVWDKYWDHNKSLFLEKSPPNIIRGEEIEEYFHPASFLIMVRNPYAHCEGLIRRHNYEAKGAAEFAIYCLRQQKENSEKLKNTLCFTYEDLVKDPKSISKKIHFFLPQIDELRHHQKFKVQSIDGRISREIMDLNEKKIQNLSVRNLKQINNVFKSNSDILDYWGYKYYETTMAHFFLYVKAKAAKFRTN